MERVNAGEEGSGEWEVIGQQPKQQDQMDCQLLQERQGLVTAPEAVAVGVMMDLDTIVLLEPQLASACCSEQQWKKFIHQQASLQRQRQPKSGLELTLEQRNSLLSIEADHLQQRLQLWSTVPPLPQSESVSLSECDKQSMLTILAYELSQDDIAALRKNCVKIEGMLVRLGECEGSADGARISKYSGAMMQWIYDAVVRLAVEDKQMGYSKGIEYLCLGIVVAYPCFNLQAYDAILHHLMYRVGLRELYLEGFPYFFKQLGSIQECLKEGQAWLWQATQSKSADFKNLFITYYRTCLLYRLSHPTPIRKVMELLLIYGLPTIRTLLLRLIAKQREGLQQQARLLQRLSSALLNKYAENSKSESDWRKVFKDLFII